MRRNCGNSDKGIENALKNYALHLIPPEDFIKTAKDLSHKVFDVLKRNSKYSIDRTFHAGSLGKNTAIRFSDIDCTIFVNDVKPPFEEVLEDFEDVLILHEGELRLEDFDGSIRKFGNRLIKLKFEDGFSMDLLPASNFMKNQSLGGRDKAERVEIQRREVLKRMNSDNFMDYSTSLSEYQLLFLKRQSPFTLTLVRLTKSWYKSLFLGDSSIYGIKTILELIAIAVAQKEQKSLYTAFDKFLNCIIKIDKLQLQFREGGGGMADLKFLRGSHNQNFILEPANPLNNLALNFEKKKLELENLKTYAKVTKNRLHNVDSRNIKELFRPQPEDLLNHLEENYDIERVDEFLVSSTYDEQLQNPKMEWRRDDCDYTPRVKTAVEAIKKFLVTAVHSAVGSMDRLDLNKVQQAVTKVIDEDIRGEEHRKWNSDDDEHEDFDVTFTIPVEKGDDSGCIMISTYFNI